jgi:hypothetical protein
LLFKNSHKTKLIICFDDQEIDDFANNGGASVVERGEIQISSNFINNNNNYYNNLSSEGKKSLTNNEVSYYED